MLSDGHSTLLLDVYYIGGIVECAQVRVQTTNILGTIVRRYGLESTVIAAIASKHLEQIFVTSERFIVRTYGWEPPHYAFSSHYWKRLMHLIYSPAMEIRYTTLGDLIMHAACIL